MKQFIGFIMITALLMGCATKQKTEVQSQIAQNETPSDTTEEQVVENADSTCAVALLENCKGVKPPCDKPTSQKVVLNEEEQAIFDDVMKACLEDIEVAKKRGNNAFSAEICPKFSEASVLLVRKIKQAVHGN